MPTTKIEQIKDAELKASMQAAHASLKSGNFLDVVQRAADADRYRGHRSYTMIG